MGFSPAGPRARRFRSDLSGSRGVPHKRGQEAEKTMMPIDRKCYIVLRATASLRKDSL